MFPNQRIRCNCATSHNVLPGQQILITIIAIEASEIARAVNKRRTHANIYALIRWQEISPDDNGVTYWVSSRFEFGREFLRVDTLLLRVVLLRRLSIAIRLAFVGPG